MPWGVLNICTKIKKYIEILRQEIFYSITEGRPSWLISVCRHNYYTPTPIRYIFLFTQETKIGTPFWMSPEVISKHKYNSLTDIWSLGITAIELAEGQPPLSHMHPVRAMFVIKSNPPQSLTDPEKWSKDFNDFVSSCLRINVDERPSATQLL